MRLEVHGQPDPGCVLHQGVGNVDLLMIAVDNGKDKMVCAGPVLSHYGFEMPSDSASAAAFSRSHQGQSE